MTHLLENSVESCLKTGRVASRLRGNVKFASPWLEIDER
jgi:hypothetical protein